ncbi:unnamed protein product [Rotaria sp. Silwood2]|nr:unnamed protein product [Rotaria sp. Silwood2]
MPRCTVGVVANTSDEEYLRRFYRNTLYRNIQYVSSYGDGIDLLRSHIITYLIMDHSMARYYLTRDVFKLIRISDDNFGTFGLSLGFSKFDTDLKDNMTNILLSYVDKGIIQRLHDDWYVYENCETKLLNENRELSFDRFFGVFMLLIGGMVLGFIILILEWLMFKYAVPYWRKRQWPGWMFLSQRVYAVLNASNDVYYKAYPSQQNDPFTVIGKRLHYYSTRRDSLDLHVVNVPKLLTTTYQLKEKIRKINEQQQQEQQQQQHHQQQEQQQIPFISPNGGLRLKKENYDRLLIRKRIKELEQELRHLRSQLIKNSTTINI